MLTLVSRFQPATVPLGVTVPTTHIDHPEVVRSLRGYHIRGWLLVVITVALAIFATHDGALAPAWLFACSLFPLLIMLVNYRMSTHRLRALKASEQWLPPQRIAEPTQGLPPRKAIDPCELDVWLPSPHLVWGLNVAAFLLPVPYVLAVAAVWDTIPAVVPTHWNAQGQADAWADKSITTVFLPTIIMVFLSVILAGVNALMLHTELHPRTHKGVAGVLRNHAMMRYSALFVAIVIVMLVGAIGFLQVVSVVPGLEHFMPWVLPIVLVSSLGGAVAMLVASIIVVRRIDQAMLEAGIGGATADGTPDNDDHLYKWGLFYYNPDDPAVLVDKRFGVGLDFNYARWQAKVAVIGLVLITVVPLTIALWAG